MIVKKIRGQNKIGLVIITSAEIASAKRMSIPINDYIKQSIIFIAIKRKWRWYFNKEKNT
jgi:hypothetical protein